MPPINQRQRLSSSKSLTPAPKRGQSSVCLISSGKRSKRKNPEQETYGNLRHSIVFINTIHRVGSYIVGLAVGFFILEVRSGRALVWWGWFSSPSILIITVWTSVFMSSSYEDAPWLTAIYLLLTQLCILGTAWIILACTFGYGGWLGRMLSWSSFLPLARLSFGIYLIHFCVQTTQIYRMRQPFNMDVFEMVLQCMSDYTVSAGLATVLYLAVEAPSSRVVNHLLRPSTIDTAQSSQSNGTVRNKQEKIKDS
ncbi:hypothetical protein J6590_048318 [Homalodisca vitripennis]|nr:hypothetical protein J6590_048318 [Homalodisca vitripennis]